VFPQLLVPMAQWIRRLPTEQEIPGSVSGKDSFSRCPICVCSFWPRSRSGRYFLLLCMTAYTAARSE
jgi:hypothetical protein